jgi:hypothetical protein
MRTTLTDSVLTPGTLGYTGAFTVSSPNGTPPSTVSQAEQAAATAEQKVSADEQALSSATALERDQGMVAAASASLSAAETTLTQARAQLSTDQQLACPPASSSTVTSGGSSASSPGSATSSSSSVGRRLAALDATTSSPTVSTGSDSGTTTVATELSGTVNPNGLVTSYAFHYGTSAAMTSSTPVGTIPAGSTTVDVSATVQGLTPNTTYLFVLVATNADSTSSGITQSLSTDESSCSVQSTVTKSDTQAVTQARDAPRLLRAIVVLAGCAGPGVLLGACGSGAGSGAARPVASLPAGGHVASSSGAATGGPVLASTGQALQHDDDLAVAYARCLRSHGIDEPDPRRVAGHPGLRLQIPQPSAAFQRADRQCGGYLSKLMALKQAAVGQASPSVLAALTRYAACMRAHDIAMLDPTPQGQLDLGNVAGITSDNGRYSPQFRSADSACRHLLPAGVHDDGSGP